MYGFESVERGAQGINVKLIKHKKMSTLKFKTNAKCGGCVAAIGAKLNQLVKEDAWSIDLKSLDKTLTITTDLPAEAIVAAVGEAGFKATVLS